MLEGQTCSLPPKISSRRHSLRPWKRPEEPEGGLRLCAPPCLCPNELCHIVRGVKRPPLAEASRYSRVVRGGGYGDARYAPDPVGQSNQLPGRCRVSWSVKY